MEIKNVEIKAKTNNPDNLRKYLNENKAIFQGIDTQIDTYYNSNKGRLKFRSGNIENSLIFYERDNKNEAKESDIFLIKNPSANYLEILEKSLGIKVIVKKQREIYFIDNVKFHIDTLENLGTFVEIEVIDDNNEYSIQELTDKCNYYMQEMSIQKTDLLTHSYSDMIMGL